MSVPCGLGEFSYPPQTHGIGNTPKRSLMRKFEKVVLHTDSSELSYHASCAIPAIVPVFLNFQEAEGESIGRATLTRDPETGTITGDIYVDRDDELGHFALGTSPDADIMDFEGTNWIMKGNIASVSVVTPDVVARLTAEDESAPEPSVS